MNDRSRGIVVGLATASLALALGASDPRAQDDRCGGLVLVDVARDVGLAFVHEGGLDPSKPLPETMGSGAAWLDADGDLDLDLYVVQSGPYPPDGGTGARNRLFVNRGDGTFVDVTDRAGDAGDRGYGQGVVAADYDGDGHVDLYVCNDGPDVLLRNRGDGTFEDVTAAAGIDVPGWSSSAAFADHDGDGDLDLYVTRYLVFDPADDVFCGDPETGERRYCDPSLFGGAADVLYANRGDGTFEDVTVAAGLEGANGKGLGVLFTDLDGDGDPDLYVANDLTINHLFTNRGDGTFVDDSLFAGAGVNRQGKVEAGMGVAVGDVDGDLDPDLVVTNFDVETNTLYRNDGGMTFEDVAAESGFGVPSFNLLGFGIVLEDLDLDGDLDAYVANGHIFERPTRDATTYRQRDLLLLGDGAGGFEEARCGPAFDAREVGRGLAAADWDDDGDVDLVVVNNRGPLQALENRRDGGRWLGLRLLGEAPNTEAVGAVVTLETSGGSLRRWVTAGDSYQSSSDRRVRFGIPDGASIESLVVAWPGGPVDTWAGDALVEGTYHDLARGLPPESRTPATPATAPLRWPVFLAAPLLLIALVVVWRHRRRRRSRP